MQKVPLWTGVAVLVVATAFSFAGGIVLGAQRNGISQTALASALLPVTQPSDVDFSPVWRAWQVIDQRYVPSRVGTSTATTSPNGATDPQERVWGLVQGLAASLDDPYTVFLPPAEAEIFEDDISGAFEGVGMEIAIRDQRLVVVSPLKDSPAFKAGVKAGDHVYKIDGVETRGLGVDEAVTLIRGPKGSTVVLTMIREGESEPIELSVTRDVINIPTIQTELRPDGVFVIELYNFSAISSGVFRDALREFVQTNSNKLILDLRGNPGGYLQAAVEMASWFLKSGEVVVTEDYADRDSAIVHKSLGYDIFTDKLDMVILVDRGSASASEILAGALRHYKIATLVGTNTFGKGSVQELVPITQDTSLKITIARWLDPAGVQIPNDGIAPDILVEVTEEDVEAGRDPILERAITFLRTGM